MVKKTYIIPAIEVSLAEAEQIIAASITHVGGDSGIDKIIYDDAPLDGDAKEFDFFGDDLFDD